MRDLFRSFNDLPADTVENVASFLQSTKHKLATFTLKKEEFPEEIVGWKLIFDKGCSWVDWGIVSQHERDTAGQNYVNEICRSMCKLLHWNREVEPHMIDFHSELILGVPLRATMDSKRPPTVHTHHWNTSNDTQSFVKDFLYMICFTLTRLIRKKENNLGRVRDIVDVEWKKISGDEYEIFLRLGKNNELAFQKVLEEIRSLQTSTTLNKHPNTPPPIPEG